ncbi:MAG: GxxExxY protein [Planctomycetes bacterium]|nr:GxxExxY protein [Planctomycetota bacterium]
MIEKINLIHKETTGKIIGLAMEIYNQLGRGFLESVYEEAFAYELKLNKINFKRQEPVDVYYKGKKIKQFVCDLIVEDKVIVELKAIKRITELEIAQTINYLNAVKYEVGLLINFGSKSLEFKRLIKNNPRNQ